MQAVLVRFLQDGALDMARVRRIHIRNENLAPKFKYAEEWHDRAVHLYSSLFEDGGYTLPSVRVSVGFSDGGYKEGRQKNTIAVCYARRLSSDGANQIFITPVRTEPVDVLFLLGHELIHAVDDCRNGHRKPFHDIAQKIGHWDAKNLGFAAMQKFYTRVESMALELGRYPRGELNLG